MNKILKTTLKESEITKQVCKDFTLDFPKEHIFETHYIDKNILPKNFNIGLIVGTSGSGKSILLKEFNNESHFEFSKDEAVCSHFKDYQDAKDKLMGVGFNSIPNWLAPFHTLSTGQKYRVQTAINLKDRAVFDEFTSVVDRATALSMSYSLGKLIRKKDYRSIVFASPHKDIIEYLEPCWVYNTDDRTLTINDKIYSIENMLEIEFTKKPEFMRYII